MDMQVTKPRTRRTWWLAGVLLLLLLPALGCTQQRAANNQVPDLEAMDAAVRRISVQDAKREADAGRAVLVDSRSSEQFAVRRIAGAVSAPLADVQRNPVLPSITGLPKEALLVFYCT